MTGQAGQAPGVVKVRLAGELADIEAVAALLGAGLGRGVEEIERSAHAAMTCVASRVLQGQVPIRDV